MNKIPAEDRNHAGPWEPSEWRMVPNMHSPEYHENPIPQFPGYDWTPAIKDLIINRRFGNWEDHSWHNDAMPHIVNTKIQVCIWVSVMPISEREPGLEWTYSVQAISTYNEKGDWEYGDRVFYFGDDWAEAYEALKTRARRYLP